MTLLAVFPRASAYYRSKAELQPNTASLWDTRIQRNIHNALLHNIEIIKREKSNNRSDRSKNHQKNQNK
jgi:hypothetical protein